MSRLLFGWNYFLWKVDILSTTSTSPVFEMPFKPLICAFEFKLITFMNTAHDMFAVYLKSQVVNSGFNFPMSLAVFIQAKDGRVRFLQKLKQQSSSTDPRELLVWKINRLKFIEESESLLETGSTNSKLVNFLCVFGPVCESLDEPIFKFIPSNPDTDSYRSLSSDFTEILKAESFSDIVLKCHGQSFPAHKNILSGRSSVFAAMFKHDMSENRKGAVDITDIDATTLSQFLQYVYSGKMPILSLETALLLYKAGHKYAVEALKKACATYVVNNLIADNACDVLAFADAHGDEDFKARVISFIKREEYGVLKQEEWRTFRRNHPTLALEVHDACNE